MRVGEVGSSPAEILTNPVPLEFLMRHLAFPGCQVERPPLRGGGGTSRHTPMFISQPWHACHVARCRTADALRGLKPFFVRGEALADYVYAFADVHFYTFVLVKLFESAVVSWGWLKSDVADTAAPRADGRTLWRRHGGRHGSTEVGTFRQSSTSSQTEWSRDAPEDRMVSHASCFLDYSEHLSSQRDAAFSPTWAATRCVGETRPYDHRCSAWGLARGESENEVGARSRR